VSDGSQSVDCKSRSRLERVSVILG
jgi:hypothetical protein